MSTFQSEPTNEALELFTALRTVITREQIRDLTRDPAQINALFTYKPLRETGEFVHTSIQDVHFPRVALKYTLLRQFITTLGALSLYSEDNISLVSGVGPVHRTQLHVIMNNHHLTFRKEGESVVEKALRLYPNANDMPIHVITLSILPGTEVNRRIQHRFADNTIGDFVSTGKVELRKKFVIPPDPSVQVKTIERFLASVNLQLAD